MYQRNNNMHYSEPLALPMENNLEIPENQLVHSEQINSKPERTINTTAELEQGYEDERFEGSVSKNYHCAICFNVFKDPVMCHNNEHLFCRACITKHLKNSRTCPSCMDELTVDMLREAPRIATDCLSEFKIRCEFFSRGCGFIELGKLEKHVQECGYAPVVCSNEGCGLKVNKRDLIHHETTVCEHRRVKCHNCGEMREELNKVNEKLDKMEGNFTQLNDTLKELGVKLNRLEILEASVRSLESVECNNRRDEKLENKKCDEQSSKIAASPVEECWTKDNNEPPSECVVSSDDRKVKPRNEYSYCNIDYSLKEDSMATNERNEPIQPLSQKYYGLTYGDGQKQEKDREYVGKKKKGKHFRY